MRDLVEKFSKPCELVVDPFSGTFATACLELLRLRHFVGCKVDVGCPAASTKALDKTYARQILGKKSDNLCKEKLVNVYRIVLRASNCSRARKWGGSWNVPVVLCSAPMFPWHITLFLSNMFVDGAMFEEPHQIEMNRSSSTWQARFHRLNVERLLAVKYRAIEVASRTSDISGRNAGRGVSAARPVGKRSIV